MKNEELSNEDLVLYVLYLLGGWQKRIHTEDVALKCFKIAPSKFSWTKYPQYPDLTPARFALESAKKKVNGSLVEGVSERRKTTSHISGWRLTTDGINWIKEHIERIKLVLGKGQPKGYRSAIDKLWLERERSIAYKKFIKENSCKSVKDYEFTDFLDANLDTPPQILKERFSEIQTQATEAKKEDILKFLNQCEQKFANLLGGKNEK